MSSIRNKIDEWLLDAMQKQADRGETSHSVGKADGGTKPATEGSRGSENASDVKSQIPGQPVDAAKGSGAEGAGIGQSAPVATIGTDKAPTGEAPGVETSSVKNDKDDPGTSHPAKAGSLNEMNSLSQSIISDIAVATSVKAAASVVVPPKIEIEVDKSKVGVKKDEPKKDELKKDEPKKDVKKDADEVEAKKAAALEAHEAGKQVVDEIIKASGLSDKETELLESIIKSAQVDADNVADFLSGFVKASEGEIDPALMAALAGGAGAPGAGAPMPVDPAAVAAPEAGAEVSPEIEQLAQILAEAGVTPEELIEAIAEEANEGGQGGQGVPVEEEKVPVDASISDKEAAFNSLSSAKKAELVVKAVNKVLSGPGK
jgi:hypothetical protein